MSLYNENPWGEIFSSTIFAMHTTMQHTPTQLVFGRDAILNIIQEANWQLIKHHKQALINIYAIRKKIAVANLMCTKPETKFY